jgi:putative FmdB family regulatory protein
VPIYEYLCQSCDHRFEIKQSIKDDPITSCIRCGREVRKLISSPAIMFKGSGWYVTDYSDKLKPAAGSEGADKPTEKPADGKNASTPASTGSPAPASPAPAASKESAAPAAGSTAASNSTTPTPATSSS